MDNSHTHFGPDSAIPQVTSPAAIKPGAQGLVLTEMAVASIQLSGFGSGSALAAWMASALKVAPQPNTFVSLAEGRVDIAAIAPATWLMSGVAADLDSIVASARVELEEVAAITELSDGRNVFLQLEGEPAATVLSKYIDIDFEGGALAPGRCASTGIHDTAVLVICRRPDLFQIVVHRSLAPSLAETLVDGAAEFGVNVERLGE
ncbi:sarcosine oxidase subunit gamma [Bordetella bronchiseptica]|uniref:sarcosine oxidase subunit gamma n=1 Tax=Bordetella bronchiseptica TaxID=518 RepID=UPI00052856E4|nr:sarcosine oxidase subunit gamma [Bordetella bronchiseptica]